MRRCLAVLLILHLTVSGAPKRSLTDFELTDQHAQTRRYSFPKSKVTFMTVSDHKGSEQLAPWIQSIYDRYGARVDIDGIADVSMIPKPFHNFFRSAFRKKMKRSVLLDWSGTAVKQFNYREGVANIYVVDRSGQIVEHFSGPLTAPALRAVMASIDANLL